MIAVKDIEQILIGDLRSLIDVSCIFTEDDIPEGVVDAERITLHTKELRTQTYFNKCFVEVNWCVPDLGDKPDSIRLQEVDRQMADIESVGEYDGTAYRYGVESIRILKDELKCHYVNTRLLFEILNVK